MKALNAPLDALCGGKVRQTYPVLTTYLIAQGNLNNLDRSFTEEELHTLIQSQGQVTTPLFMHTPPEWADRPAATLYITVNWELGTYDVYRIT